MKLLLALLAISLIGCKSIPVNHTEKETSTDTKPKTDIQAQEFYYEYVKGYELVLMFPDCDKPYAKKKASWLAEVRDLKTGEKANGCWMKHVERVEGMPTEFVNANIDLCTKESQQKHPEECSKQKLDFSFPAKQFTPRF